MRAEVGAGREGRGKSVKRLQSELRLRSRRRYRSVHPPILRRSGVVMTHPSVNRGTDFMFEGFIKPLQRSISFLPHTILKTLLITLTSHRVCSVP
jgi:hypothetical protein